MPEFSETSKARLASCDARLRRVFDAVVAHFDCTIICGHRGREAQEQAFAEGKSKARWGESPHNTIPSRAVDAVPYPIDWEDREVATFFAGYVLGTARAMGVSLRWGGDWDRDNRVADNEFDDLWHFELVEEGPASGAETGA